MKILIAEDDVTSRLFMSRFLERFGSCDVAINGVEVIDMVAERISSGEHYDLICMDVMMPKVDGIKALESIRGLEKKAENTTASAKVIMTTALNDKATVEDAYAAGADAYEWKPIDMDRFSEILDSLGFQEQ